MVGAAVEKIPKSKCLTQLEKKTLRVLSKNDFTSFTTECE